MENHEKLEMTKMDNYVKAMKEDKDLQKNADGYSDPTSYAAIKNVDKESYLVKRLLKTIWNMADICGFRIDGRITFINKKSGNVWR